MRTVVETIGLGSVKLRIERPAAPEELLDESRFAEDEFLPYWAEPWPSGEALARHVTARALAGRRVVEVGCGLGLPALTAALGGARVLATDWAPEAIALLARNARRNGLDPELLTARRIDWREPAALVADGPFDLLLAADVLYEERNAAPLVELVEALECEALVADPGRRHAKRFLAALRAAGREVVELADPLLPLGAVYALTARPGGTG